MKMAIKCINNQNVVKDDKSIKLERGKVYYTDLSTLYSDEDDIIYADVYEDEEFEKHIGICYFDKFRKVNRDILIGGGISLTIYINVDVGLLLKDILTWCFQHQNFQISSCLINYVNDNIKDKDCCEKEYYIKSKPVAKMGEDYMKYLGYSLEEVKD